MMFFWMIIGILVGLITGAVIASARLDDKLFDQENVSEKYYALYVLMCKWVRIKQDGKSISEYLNDTGSHSIIIYGMNYVGQRLVAEIEGSDLEIVCGIDQRDIPDAPIKVIKPYDSIPEADIMIVTPYTYFDEIEIMMRERTDSSIISIDELLERVDLYVDGGSIEGL